MMRTGVRAVAVVAGAVLLASVLATAQASFAADSPRAALELSTQHAAPGEYVVARLDRWPAGVVMLSTCGNAARRGSRDCDLLGAQSVKVARVGPTIFDLKLTVPPVGCPCVVRASDSSNAVVRTVPFVLLGVSDGPELADTGAGAPSVRVTAKVEDADASWLRSASSAVGAGGTRRLVVTVRNTGASDVSGLRMNAIVGRDEHSGSVASTRSLPTLAAGRSRRFVMSVDLPTPTFGDYVVYGSVAGTTTSVPFRATTSSEPWALWLLVPIGLLITARLLRRRERRRATAPHDAGAARSIELPTLPQCSPDVGNGSGERWAFDPYPSDVPAANGSSNGSHAAAPVPQPT